MMVNINISPDTYSEQDDLFQIIGNPKYKYYVEVSEIERFILDYFCGLNKFPLYLTMSTYNDYEHIETLLKNLGQDCQIQFLADIVYASTEDGGTLKYNVPLFTITITDAIALKAIITNTFWLGESNCTYFISFSNNISFKNEVEKDWRGKDIEVSTLLIDMSQQTTTICITHDAYGFYLFSNFEEYNSVESVIKQFPKY
jgi:hypothetical protein